MSASSRCIARMTPSACSGRDAPCTRGEGSDSARAIDASAPHIIVKHILPNAIAPTIVSTTMNIGNSIISGATLSFIGLGAQPPIAEWGAMLSEGRNLMRDHMDLMLYPGLCIMITVLAFNMLGDGLRDAMDPRLRN